MAGVLITGFEPFGGETVNPSWEVVKQLDGMIIRGQQVVAKQLPCVFGEALTVLKAALETYQPRLTIAVGQAGGRVDITVERVAINVDDARIPDNKGQQPIDEPIVANGPAACFSTLPIKAIVSALRQQGIPASVSQTAGTFVCNHVMYGLLHQLQGKRGQKGGFIHIPYLPEQAAAHPGQASMSVATVRAALETAIAVALEQDDDVKIGGGATHEQKDDSMPEGPEIRRAADKLEAAIKGEPLTNVWFAFPQLQPYQTQLTGQRVTHIATRGKALLTHFSGGLTLYSHNQLYGVWRVVDAGVEPQSNRVLRVRLQTASKAILLYSASDIDILTAEQVANHPFLLRVGPDVLDMTLTAEQVKARLLSAKFRNRQFSGLLLDQAFLAGLGNYLRVEILWQVGLSGKRKAAELSDSQLDALAHALLDIPRLSYPTRGLVDDNKHHGALFRCKVFHRDGERCERCGGIIEKTTLSSRPFYWCPGCQH